MIIKHTNNYKKYLNNYIKYWSNLPELLPTYTIICISRFNIKDYKATNFIEKFYLTSEDPSSMLLDTLFQIQQYSPSLAFRKSCREGICGSCSMNINGTNSLACLYKLKESNNKATHYIYKSSIKNNQIIINPLPHLPVIKDLVVSLDHFYNQYKEIEPYKINNKSDAISSKSSIIRKKDRALIDGIYECILCACCTASCPSYWWNSDTYLGPAVLLQSFRWIIDNNDDNAYNRLTYLNDNDKLNKCHNIMNCSLTCPKGLKPAESIVRLKNMVDNVNSKIKTERTISYLNGTVK